MTVEVAYQLEKKEVKIFTYIANRQKIENFPPSAIQHVFLLDIAKKLPIINN